MKNLDTVPAEKSAEAETGDATPISGHKHESGSVAAESGIGRHALQTDPGAEPSQAG